MKHSNIAQHQSRNSYSSEGTCTVEYVGDFFQECIPTSNPGEGVAYCTATCDTNIGAACIIGFSSDVTKVYLKGGLEGGVIRGNKNISLRPKSFPIIRLGLMGIILAQIREG